MLHNYCFISHDFLENFPHPQFMRHDLCTIWRTSPVTDDARVPYSSLVLQSICIYTCPQETGWLDHSGRMHGWNEPLDQKGRPSESASFFIFNRWPTLTAEWFRRKSSRTQVMRRESARLFARIKSYDSYEGGDSFSLPSSDSHGMNVSHIFVTCHPYGMNHKYWTWFPLVKHTTWVERTRFADVTRTAWIKLDISQLTIMRHEPCEHVSYLLFVQHESHVHVSRLPVIRHESCVHNIPTNYSCGI